MKKLSLKKLNLGANDMLQREELKSVFGGYDGCQAIVGGMIYWGLSVSQAQSYYNQGVNANVSSGYCCASCSSTSWAI